VGWLRWEMHRSARRANQCGLPVEWWRGIRLSRVLAHRILGSRGVQLPPAVDLRQCSLGCGLRYGNAILLHALFPAPAPPTIHGCLLLHVLQATFENCMKVLMPGGTLSSVGVYSGYICISETGFGAGLSNILIITALCPGGRARMHRLMRLVAAHRIDLTPLFRHSFTLDQIQEAYAAFAFSPGECPESLRYGRNRKGERL